MRIAHRSVEKGDTAKAAELLDQVLAVEPLNREALHGRATLYLEKSRAPGTSADDRAAAVTKAAELVRSLRRAHEAPKPVEQELFGRTLYALAQDLVNRNQMSQALAVLKEIADSGVDSLWLVETDESMARLKSTPEYRAALKASDEAKLAQARAGLGDTVKRPLDIPFDFSLPDLDGKTVSLKDLKGKVVVVDYWGTWCGPCREAIPHLITLYRKRHDRGLEIVGLSYERDMPDPAKALAAVKKFAGEVKIPYRCLMGNEAAIRQIPDFKGFPASVVIDRSGRVRLLVTENEKNTLDVIAAVVEILLAEPADSASGPAKKPG